MNIFRPAVREDLDDIMQLVDQVGIGMTSLPNNKEFIARRIERSLASFQQVVPRSAQGFLFVLWSTVERRVIGISGIERAVGLESANYHYRLQPLTIAVESLDVFNQLSLLVKANEYLGCSELCSLFLSPSYQNQGNGLLLSKARLLFIANFSELFADLLFAQLRGVIDQHGESPFWHGLGQQFTGLTFSEMEALDPDLCEESLSDAFPDIPILTQLLPPTTQQVIGIEQSSGQAAKRILEREGFYFRGTINLSDGGPLLEAHKQQIPTLCRSRLAAARQVVVEAGESLLIANTQFAGFRAMLVTVPENSQPKIQSLTPEILALLGVEEQEPLRIISLNSSGG